MAAPARYHSMTCYHWYDWRSSYYRSESQLFRHHRPRWPSGLRQPGTASPFRRASATSPCLASSRWWSTVQVTFTVPRVVGHIDVHSELSSHVRRQPRPPRMSVASCNHLTHVGVVALPKSSGAILEVVGVSADPDGEGEHRSSVYCRSRERSPSAVPATSPKLVPLSRNEPSVNVYALGVRRRQSHHRDPCRSRRT